MATEVVAIESTPAQPQPSTKKPSAKKAVRKKPQVKRVATTKRATKKSAGKARSAKKKAAKKTPSKVAAAKKSVAKKKTSKKAAAKNRPTKKRKSKKRPAPANVNKAQAIRDAAKDIGGELRPRDIIAALAANGITVTSPQVSMTLKAAGLRKGRRKRKVAVLVAPEPSSSDGRLFDINDLLQVKQLAKELGGTAMLKELATALERLL